MSPEPTSPHPQRVANLLQDSQDMGRLLSADESLERDDAYVSEHPEHENPERRGAILAPVLALHQRDHWCDAGFTHAMWFRREQPCPTARAAGVSEVPSNPEGETDA